MMYDVLDLITETVTTNRYGQEVITGEKKAVYCRVESITQNEFFNAAQANLNPEYKFVIFTGDYDGQKILEFQDNAYSVYRTYSSGDDLELYVERVTGVWPISA